MFRYLREAKLTPPFVLVATSYGGNVSRQFLQRCSKNDVVGMVLAETGQETALDPDLEARQYRLQVLGDKPLSVIRCNSLIRKWEQYEAALAVAEDEPAKRALLEQKQVLDAWDAEDERLKKKQLALSSNSRYVRVPDCGHDVVRDRPEVVVEEVRWVMETWETTPERGKRRLWPWVSNVLDTLRNKWQRADEHTAHR